MRIADDKNTFSQHEHIERRQRALLDHPKHIDEMIQVLLVDTIQTADERIAIATSHQHRRDHGGIRA